MWLKNSKSAQEKIVIEKRLYLLYMYIQNVEVVIVNRNRGWARAYRGH